MKHKICTKCKGTGGFWNPISAIKEGAKRAYAIIFGRGVPPKVRELIKNYGNEQIKAISICRKPIESTINTALNWLSLGKLNTLKTKYNYDNLFHLYMNITLANGKVVQLEKNASVTVSYINAVDSNCGMEVNISKPLTIGELLGNAEKNVGSDIWKYNASTNNCQHYQTNLLRFSGLLTPELSSYINQDVESILSKLPSFVRKIIDTTTDLGAKIDTATQGAGKKKKMLI